MQASTHMIMDCRIHAKMPGQLRIVSQASKMRLSASSLLTWLSQVCLGVPTDENTEDSSQASVEAMQWVLLYLSIGHDKCYSEHLAQQG
jgi:hypothetical protein